MRINTQFPVAVHVLAFVGLYKNVLGEAPTSLIISKSVNTNPVVIRRINSLLKSAGLITVRPGIGGVELSKQPEEITLRSIFIAVQSGNETGIFDFHKNVNGNCEVGSVINQVLESSLNSAQLAMEMELEKSSLLDVMKEITLKSKQKSI